MTSIGADATMKSLRWHDAVFKLMRGLRADSFPNLGRAIHDLAILISPPFDRQVRDDSGAIRYYSEVVRGPLPASDSTSTIAIGRVNGPTVYDLMATAASGALGNCVNQNLDFNLMRDLVLLTATDQALFARFANLDLPPENEIHRSYLDKALKSFETIAEAGGLGLDYRSGRLIGQALTKLVRSIDIRVAPVASANVGVRSDPAPRNWIFDSGNANIGAPDLVASGLRPTTAPRFRRFPDNIRRIDIPATVGYGLYFEDFAHLTDFHWARLDTEQKMTLRFAGDMVREMLLTVFDKPHDSAAIVEAERLAEDIDRVVNRASWTARIRERFEQWARLNAWNYEIGGLLRKLRQIELNLSYRENVMQKIQRSESISTTDADLQQLIELEVVGYLKSCAEDIYELGNEGGLTADELTALSNAISDAAENLSGRFGLNQPHLVRLRDYGQRAAS